VVFYRERENDSRALNRGTERTTEMAKAATKKSSKKSTAKRSTAKKSSAKRSTKKAAKRSRK